MHRRLPLALLIWLSFPVFVFAQDQPVTANFSLSTDHTVTVAGSTGPVNVVTRYEVRAVPNTGTTVVKDIGKPAGTNGAPVSVALTLPPATYKQGIVCAIGPGGEGCSGPSSPFTVSFPLPPAPAAPGVPSFK